MKKYKVLIKNIDTGEEDIGVLKPYSPRSHTKVLLHNKKNEWDTGYYWGDREHYKCVMMVYYNWLWIEKCFEKDGFFQTRRLQLYPIKREKKIFKKIEI